MGTIEFTVARLKLGYIKENNMNQLSLSPYKGFVGSINVNFETRTYYGSIQGTRFEVEYEADSVEKLQDQFEQSVDWYIDKLGEENLN